MKLFLQTSSGQPSLVLWDDGVVFEVQFDQMLDYGRELGKALAKVGRNTSDLDGVIVDIGPGRLGSTRTAVAFANGLGFALGIPVIPLSSFVILGIFGEIKFARTCLVLRKAARRQYHWALVKAGAIIETGFTTEASVSPKSYQGPVVIAGDATEDAVALPTLLDTLWPDLNIAPGAALAQLQAKMVAVEGQAVPLTETREVVYGK